MVFVLKKLILKEWFRGFLGATSVLFLLVSVANLISGFLRSSITTREVIVGYLLEVPTFLGLILPISCLVASMFSINKLKNRNELTAIFAAGYSRKQLVLDIFQAALVVALIQFLVSGFLDPFARRNRDFLLEEGNSRLRAFRSQGLKASTIGSGKIWYKSGNYFFSFTAFDKNRDVLKDVDIYYFNQDQLISKIIKAQEASHLVGLTWMLLDTQIAENLAPDGFPVFESFESIVLDINETIDDFKQIEADVTTLDPRGLANYINRLDMAGINTNEYKVMLYNKFASSLICLIFALIASIGIFNPNRRNSSFGQNIFFVFVFTLLYWLIYSYTLELGNSSKIHPIAATFLVPTIFSCFLLFFFVRHRRLR